LQTSNPAQQSTASVPAFPKVERQGGITGLFGGEDWTKINKEGRTLWEAGRYAETLAMMWGAERVSLASGDITRLRNACEQALGLEASPGVRWLPGPLARLFPTGKVVVRDCLVFSVPDETAPSAPLREGSVAVVEAHSGDWLYIETHGGLSGWIKAEHAVAVDIDTDESY
jgi:hypothetical protein